MINNIINNFINQNATQIGGTKLFTPQGAKELVRLLTDNGRKILGVDGIFVIKEGRRPSMEDSILTYKLYDDGISAREIMAKIFQFVDERSGKKDLFFEIVFK